MLGRLLILLHLATITRVMQVLVLMMVPFGSVVIVVVYNIVYEDAVRLLLALRLRIADLVIVATRNAVAVQVVSVGLLSGYEELLADIRMRFQLFHWKKIKERELDRWYHIYKMNNTRNLLLKAYVFRISKN